MATCLLCAQCCCAFSLNIFTFLFSIVVVVCCMMLYTVLLYTCYCIIVFVKSNIIVGYNVVT